MKKLIPTLACVLVFCAACQSPNPNSFTVHYTNLEDYEGDTLYLWRSDYFFITGNRDMDRGALDSSIVKNGKATFTGLADTLSFYQISGIENIEIRFYSEPGELTIYEVPYPDPTIKDYYYKSTNPHSKNVELLQLRLTNRNTPGEMRRMLKENIANGMGYYLLDNNSVDVYPDELEWVYQHSNPLIRDKAIGMMNIKKILDETREINSGDPYVDFKQKDYFTNDTVQFSEIAGKGRPTALLFLNNPNTKNSIRNEIEKLQAQYPDVRLVIPTSYYQDPENKDFMKELASHYQAVLLDDSYRFDSSARRLYRILSFYNYLYLFDAEGKLIEKKPVAYADYDMFITHWNNVLTAGSKPPLSLSSNPADYLAIPEYTVFKDFVLQSPDGIDLLLDFCLHYESTFGLNAYMIDDIVQSKYKEAPELKNYIYNASVKESEIPDLVRQYARRIRVLEKL